jgi:hypothetical protein
VYLLPKRRRSFQEDNDRSLGSPPLRYLDPRTDRGQCDIHGASSGRGVTAEKQVEAGTYIDCQEQYLIIRCARYAMSESELVYSARTSSALQHSMLLVPDRLGS